MSCQPYGNGLPTPADPRDDEERSCYMYDCDAHDDLDEERQPYLLIEDRDSFGAVGWFLGMLVVAFLVIGAWRWLA